MQDTHEGDSTSLPSRARLDDEILRQTSLLTYGLVQADRRSAVIVAQYLLQEYWEKIT